MILVADIGGTNTTFALLSDDGQQIIHKHRFSSREIVHFRLVFEQALEIFNVSLDTIYAVCFAVAGPIVNKDTCYVTNLDLYIDLSELKKDYVFPIELINDFSAICYGVTCFDVTDPKKICLLTEDVSLSAPVMHGTASIIGPGTGLGVGHLLYTENHYRAIAAEGGHVDFPLYDPQLLDLYQFVCHLLQKTHLDIERFVSGIGIANIFHYVYSLYPDNTVLQKINVQADVDKPMSISMHAHNNHIECMEIMRLFITLYARVVANLTVSCIPQNGIFLAGGITAKNIALLKQNDFFLSIYRNAYSSGVRQLLQNIPIYIVMDYDVSLYGAAYSARQLLL